MNVRVLVSYSMLSVHLGGRREVLVGERGRRKKRGRRETSLWLSNFSIFFYLFIEGHSLFLF